MFVGYSEVDIIIIILRCIYFAILKWLNNVHRMNYSTRFFWKAHFFILFYFIYSLTKVLF